ncbi:MAG: gp53-like domain-containing protein [Clostridium chrysemydis]|uniref:gp53-like domain-containing protein n=1 Tax=Clostridium chrysemydis TaxID=2665504 RepID=UPI003F2FE671
MAKEQGIPKIWEKVEKNEQDIGYIQTTGDRLTYKSRGTLPEFDGTFGDFCNKVKHGVYSIYPENANALNLPDDVYKFGNLSVEYADYGKQVVKIIYVRDGANQILTFSNWNFSNSPEGVFSKEAWTLEFNHKNCPISKSTDGWCQLANGLIIQWGLFTGATGNLGVSSRHDAITLPIQFSNESYAVIPVSGTGGVTADWNAYTALCRVSTKHNNHFYIVRTNTRVEEVYFSSIQWIAIGY